MLFEKSYIYFYLEISNLIFLVKFDTKLELDHYPII